MGDTLQQMEDSSHDSYVWKGMYQDVTKFVNKCSECAFISGELGESKESTLELNSHAEVLPNSSRYYGSTKDYPR